MHLTKNYFEALKKETHFLKIKIDQNCGEMRFIKTSVNLYRILEFAFGNISLDKLLLSLFHRFFHRKLPKGIFGWASGAERIERAGRNLQKGALRSEGNMTATLPARSHALVRKLLDFIENILICVLKMN